MNRKALTILSLALVVAAATLAQGQAAGGALSKDRLLKLLKLGDTSQQELTQAVARKGVDFQPTADDEKELRQAGASDDLIAAVRVNFRGASNSAANNAANAPQNDAQANPPADAQPAPNNAQQAQPANADAGAQGNQPQATAAPEVGFHGFQVGTYKGQAKDSKSAKVYGTDTQKLEFKIDKIDAETGEAHASFFAEHDRGFDLNGTIDEEGVLRLEGRISGPKAKIVAHVSGGVITAKYRIEDLYGVDGEFTVKFVPDDFADEFNKKGATSKRNN